MKLNAVVLKMQQGVLTVACHSFYLFEYESHGVLSILFRKLAPGILAETGKCTLQLPKQLTPILSALE